MEAVKKDAMANVEVLGDVTVSINPDDPYTMTLRRTIVVGKDTKVAELTFRPMEGADMRGLPENKLDMLLKVIGRLTGQPDAVVNKLRGADLGEAIKIAGVFMAGLQID